MFNERAAATTRGCAAELSGGRWCVFMNTEQQRRMRHGNTYSEEAIGVWAKLVFVCVLIHMIRLDLINRPWVRDLT